MNILVTGGTGFLGRHLVWRLAAAGHRVTFTGRQIRVAEDIIRQAPSQTGDNICYLMLSHGEADSAQLLNHAAQGMDAVVHSAALSSPWGKPDNFYKANVASTEEVIAACHVAGIKRNTQFIF